MVIDRLMPGFDRKLDPVPRLSQNKAYRLGLSACMAIVVSVLSLAALASPVGPTVPLIAGENAPSLREFVRYQSVPISTPVSSILESLDSASLHQVTEPIIEFGPPEGPLLVLVKVRNVSDATGTWVFSTDRGSLRHIQMFEHNARGTNLLLENDDLARQREMLRDYHAFAFPFSLAPGEERILGVVFEAESSSKLPLSIMEPGAYRSLIDTQLYIVLAASVGTLTLILLNAILFAVTGKSAFLHFVIAELALVFQAVHLSGYTTIFWFHDHAELARALSDVAKVIFALFSVRFVRAFLGTRKTWPRFERPAQVYELACWLVILCLAVYPLVPFLTLRLASVFAQAIAAMALVGLPVIAIVAVKRYGWVYSPLVLGWSIWGVYLVYTLLTVYTPLPEIPYHWRWMAPLGFFEALMLSIALGLDIRAIQHREVDAQKRLADELETRVQLLEATALAKSDREIVEQQLRETSSLVRSGGHDSRSFIGALKLYGNVIENSDNLDKSRKYGSLVTQLADELDATLNVIVEGSSGDSSSLESPVRIETLNATSLLETISKIHEQAASQANVKIRRRANVQEIIGDRHLLIRILSNLVGNALKYAGHGDILLTARRIGGHASLEVWDQGPGLAPEQLQRLMSSQRMRERLNPEVDGTGSGLGICFRLCEKMRARLSAHSVRGRGTVFRVELGGNPPDCENPGRHLAVLDDPIHWPKHVLEAVESWGMTIQFATHCDELRSTTADIVFVDPALHPTPPDYALPGKVVLCSYESPSEIPPPWTRVSPITLAKPVSSDSLSFVFSLVFSLPEPTTG